MLKLVVILGLAFFSVNDGMAQVPVLTHHNDIGRTGQNLDETILNTSNVNVATFGKLFWKTVDGEIYAQPLYVPNLTIQGKTRNVVYVATEHNSVYAFDADDPTQVTPLWQVSLGTPVPSQDICIITGDTNPSDCPYLDINPEIGITSTPVIDPVAGIIYVVAKTKRTSDSTYHFFLHALDLTSGAEQLAGPTEITGQVTGSGTGSSGGVLVFDPTYHLQRPGLLLMNGVVYLGFGSVGDMGNFHGWIMGYDATTLQQVSILNMTPERQRRRNLVRRTGTGGRRIRQHLRHDRKRRLQCEHQRKRLWRLISENQHLQRSRRRRLFHSLQSSQSF